MTTFSKRQGDPDDLDVRPLRVVDPGAWDLKLGWGDKSLSVRGVAIVLVLAVAAIVAANLYTAYQSTGQHNSITHGQDQVACIMTMTTEERTAFRKDVGPNAFERWCWWLQAQQK
jgi:hypothetical protein